MRLANTLKYFAKQRALDAYSGSFAFNCRLDTYSGTVRDSLIAGRRVITVQPATDIPIRRVIEIDARQYIVGEDFIDDYNSGILKQHLLVHPAFGLATLGTAAQIISSTGGTDVFVGLSWRKDRAEEEVSPHRFNVYNVYMSSSESVSKDNLILLEGVYYRVQNIEKTTGGFTTLYASEIGADAVSTVTYTASSGPYDPATDSRSASAPFSTSALIERYQDSYLYDNAESAKYEIGDRVITVDSLVVETPTINDTLSIATKAYRVVSFIDDGDGAWCIHVRPS